MLGDQAPKPKTSFKSIRKRKKTVTFTDPTYVDYSDFDYSSDEEDIEELFGQQGAASQQKQDQQQAGAQADAAANEIADESAKVEPLKTRTPKEAKASETAGVDAATAQEPEQETRDSDEIMEMRSEGVRQTRNGTIRNTDSFFKDDTAETKKMTLTPNLLRDDNQPRPSTDSNKDLKPRPSLDKMDKELVSDKEKKKREKDKKPSAIRSFFSRKDKKKASEDDDESFGKPSMDMDHRDSEDPAGEDQVSPEKATGPQRQSSKLQKPQPRGDPSPTRKSSGGSQKAGNVELSTYLAETRVNDVASVPPSSMRIVESDTKEAQDLSASQRQAPQERSASAGGMRDEQSRMNKGLQPRSASAALESRPQKTSKARSRMELDGSDLEEVEEPTTQVAPPDRPAPAPQPADMEANTLGTRSERHGPSASRPHLPGAFPDSYQTTATDASEQTVTHLGDRESESPLPVSPISNPPALMGDTSSQDGVSPEHSPSPEPSQEARDLPTGQQQDQQQQPQPQSWDDSKLREFFDDGEHVRDLLAVVYDKTDVVPAGNDHPVVGPLFREQNAKLAEITTVSLGVAHYCYSGANND